MSARARARELVKRRWPIVTRASALRNLGARRRDRWTIVAAVLLVRAAARFGRRARPVTLRLRRPAGTLRVRIDAIEDVAVLEELLLWGEYDVSLGDPAVIVDAGANIGVAALDFAARCPHARIVAIEPDPDAYVRLAANVAHVPAITPVQVALAAAPGRRSFFSGRDSWASGFERSHAAQREVVVEAISLDELLDGMGIERVDVLQLDVEGAEREALAGFSGLDRVALLLGELHGEEARGAGLLAELDPTFDVEVRARSAQTLTFVARRR